MPIVFNLFAICLSVDYFPWETIFRFHERSHKNKSWKPISCTMMALKCQKVIQTV